MALDLIYDFETMGQDVTSCVALSFAGIFFDKERFVSDNPYTYDELIDPDRSNIIHCKLSVEDQVKNYGRTIEQGTLDWWSKQNAEAQKVLTPLDSDLTLEELSRKLLEFISHIKIGCSWTRGNSFDPVLLDSLYKNLGIENPLPWWTIRDTRTFIEALTLDQVGLKNSFNPLTQEEYDAKFVHHDPVHDCALDIMRMQLVVKSTYE